MPDFQAEILGCATQAWVDDPTASRPSRLNPHQGHPQTYRLLAAPGGGSLTARAIVGGVAAPMDAALGGRLFTWRWAETPDDALGPTISTAAGQSSLMTATPGVPWVAGHYLLVALRESGGAVAIPLEVTL